MPLPSMALGCPIASRATGNLATYIGRPAFARASDQSAAHSFPRCHYDWGVLAYISSSQ